MIPDLFGGKGDEPHRKAQASTLSELPTPRPRAANSPEALKMYRQRFGNGGKALAPLYGVESLQCIQDDKRNSGSVFLMIKVKLFRC
ncbi:hypothetical protein [Oceanisphaera sp. KMM 10153]|uniref:hypothetical protein n=1 Tax=Oceanisphaera submarina TaxID=3390193 RepID=UPI0039756C9B